MKRIFLLLLISALFLNFTACFDDKTTPSAGGGDDTGNPLEGYTSTDITYEENTIKGYSLDQFVPAAGVNTEIGFEDEDETRVLFLYRVIASDGWNPFDDKDKTDLTWAEFSSGYLLEKAYDAKVYFPSEDISKTYDVKNAQNINLYRKIDLIKDADGTPAVISFEMSAFTAETITYWNSKETETKTGTCVSLLSLLPDYVIDSAAESSYNYKFNLADGWETGLTDGLADNTVSYADFQTAYYVLEEDGEAKDKIVFLGPESTPTQLYKSLKYPVSIEFADAGSGDNPAGSDTADVPAQAATSTPDIQFTFPAQ